MGRPTMPDPVGRIEGTLLTYVKYDHTHPKNGKHAVFECICGTRKVIQQYMVTHKITKSCGCIRKTQAEPSRLTYLRHDHYKKFKVSVTYKKGPAKQKRKISYGLYRCECGTEKVVQDNLVKTNTVRSCGCLRTDLSGRVEQLIKMYEEGVKIKKPANDDMIKIEEPIGSGRYKWITEKELEDMYYGFKEERAA